MNFERFLVLIAVFGVGILFSACTFKSEEDDTYKDSTLVEQKKDVEFQISEATLDKELQRWSHP